MAVSAYLRLMRFDRPIGIYLLLWPTLWALWLAAEGIPNIKLLSIFCMGVVVMRAAGCVINDIADRHFDPKVERTKNRPLANSELTVVQAMGCLVILLLIAVSLLVQLNQFCFLLALPAMIIVMAYPYTKRFMHTPQLVLGVAFAFSVLMAFAAVKQQLSLTAWLLFMATILWAFVYDTFYAMVDKDDDKKIAIKSSALWLGDAASTVCACCQALMLVALIFVGLLNQLTTYYYIGLVIATSLMFYQQCLVRTQNRQACFKAFLNNHYLGLAVFSGLLLDLSHLAVSS